MNKKPQESPASTKQRLLDAAEKLFYERGIDATSTRAIAKAASANSAAPNFHFGSKAELIKAVFRRRLDPLIARRLELLNSLKSEQRNPGVEAIWDTFAAPLFDMVEEGHEGKLAFLGTFARTTITPNNELQELLEEEYASYLDTYVSAFSNALPHLSRNEIAVRFDYALGAMAHAMSDPGRRAALGANEQAHRTDYVMRTLRAFLIGGLTAAPSDSA